MTTLGKNIDKGNFPIKTGAKVTFHLLRWDDGLDTFSMKAGGNINYHSLTGATIQHSHDYPEILLILSGKIKHHVNGEIKELSGGTLVFIRPNDSHRFEPFENESCELVNFAFSLELLFDLSVYLENDYFLRRFTGPVVPPTFKLSVAETDKIAYELLRLNSIQINVLEVARVKVKAILAELFTSYFLEMKNIYENPDIPEWLDELVKEMSKPKNFAKGLKRMQSLAYCTPEHLCKSFRKYLDKSPTEFINELRINHAARLLGDTNDEIMAIATDLNFQSLSRFYHVFKKHYGVSPAKYRKITKKNDIPV